jgi:pyroglutamyl-peptidase
LRSEHAVAALRPSILLTGFGAFPGVEANATAALVPALAAAARARFLHLDIVDAVLPVEWSRTPQRLDDLLSQSGAQLALHFGVSGSARGFQIELVGRNACEARHDAAGELPGAARLIAEGPDSLASTFPAERIIARLQNAGLPCAASGSAGTYLCNALLYHSLRAAHALPTPFLVGFVHLPASLSPTAGLASDCALTWDDALAGGLEIIAACLDAESVS